MIITRSKVAVSTIPAGTTSQNVEILVGDNCFMERYGEDIQGYWRLPNSSFSSSDETLMKMHQDWAVPRIYRSYSVVRHWPVGPIPLRVWYQEESQGIYRFQEEVLMEELEAHQRQRPQVQGRRPQVQGRRPQVQGQRPQVQRQRPQGQQQQQRQQQVAAMTRNVTIPLTVPK